MDQIESVFSVFLENLMDFIFSLPPSLPSFVLEKLTQVLSFSLHSSLFCFFLTLSSLNRMVGNDRDRQASVAAALV